jgi:hypothetical protein
MCQHSGLAWTEKDCEVVEVISNRDSRKAKLMVDRLILEYEQAYHIHRPPQLSISPACHSYCSIRSSHSSPSFLLHSQLELYSLAPSSPSPITPIPFSHHSASHIIQLLTSFSFSHHSASHIIQLLTSFNFSHHSARSS